jgi:hypothetical protein
VASRPVLGTDCLALPEPEFLRHAASSSEASTARPGDTLFLDLVYLYPAGSAFDETALAAEALVQLANMNRALGVISTDGVKRMVRLAGVRPIRIDVSSGDAQTIVGLAISNKETAGDIAAAKATKPRADIALIRVRELNVGGAAYISRGPESAIGVVGPGAASGLPDLFAHEIGHILALDHSAPSALNSGPYTPRDRGFTGILPDGRRFETVMSYGSDCPGGCQIEVWSYSDPTIRTDGTSFFRADDPAAPGNAVAIGEIGQSEAGEILRGEGVPEGTFEKASKYSPADLPNCTPSATALCLSGGRFKVEASWATAKDSGAGQAVALSGDTGYFSFFNPGNVEAVVKVLDGCGVNGRFWVFAGGLTNVQVVITVTDTASGQLKTYQNPQGHPFQPIQDTAALPCG